MAVSDRSFPCRNNRRDVLDMRARSVLRTGFISALQMVVVALFYPETKGTALGQYRAS